MARITNIQRRQRRKQGIRKQISGTGEIPRVSVARSANHIYAQAIDDVAAKTVAAANDLKVTKGKKSEKAAEVGKELGKALKTKKIKKIVFDRSGYNYHGRVKALADGIRESGIEF